VLPRDEVWVAELDEVLAGFIAFGRERVNQLYVAPPFQGKGLGTELPGIAKRSKAAFKTV
jgi:GNAT superfamily N-acetyltransferase